MIKVMKQSTEYLKVILRRKLLQSFTDSFDPVLQLPDRILCTSNNLRLKTSLWLNLEYLQALLEVAEAESEVGLDLFGIRPASRAELELSVGEEDEREVELVHDHPPHPGLPGHDDVQHRENLFAQLQLPLQLVVGKVVGLVALHPAVHLG